ncbi:MAG: sugar ABC transporter permease [Lachnospiraceae bacterium]|nr:sugar ABC transporter permease [Lachnospiraceae bacterium]
MNKRGVLSEILKSYTMIGVLVIVVWFFTWRTGGNMLLPQNVSNLIAQNAYVFILAVGMLLCILTGGNIDLSVGSVVAFIGAIGGVLLVQRQVPVPLAILAMLGVGILVGVWQGFWIAYVRIPPFIVTLAGMLVFRGLTNVVLGGMSISGMPSGFNVLFNSFVPDIVYGGVEIAPFGNINLTSFLVGIVVVVLYVIVSLRGRVIRSKKGYQLDNAIGYWVKLVMISAVVMAFAIRLSQHRGIPAYLIWVAAIVMIYWYITSKTTIGRHFYAVGGNEKAAELSGIKTNRVYFIAYVNVSFLAGVAALVTIARLDSAIPTAGMQFELDAIASCFIGGASAYGGIGTVPRVILGALLMGVINMGMFIMGVDSNWQRVVSGMVLLLAVIFDVLSKKKG